MDCVIVMVTRFFVCFSDKKRHSRVKPAMPFAFTGIDTIYLLKYCKIRDGFFVLSKLSEGRRSNATLTGTKQRQNGKDAQSC